MVGDGSLEALRFAECVFYRMGGVRCGGEERWSSLAVEESLMFANCFFDMEAAVVARKATV